MEGIYGTGVTTGEIYENSQMLPDISLSTSGLMEFTLGYYSKFTTLCHLKLIFDGDV